VRAALCFALASADLVRPISFAAIRARASASAIGFFARIRALLAARWESAFAGFFSLENAALRRASKSGRERIVSDKRARASADMDRPRLAAVIAARAAFVCRYPEIPGPPAV
jgi:uncharacterized protein (DUF2236 family)